MYHDAGVGQDVPLGTSGEQYRGHTGSIGAHGPDGTLDSLHRVIECQTAADLAAGTVDIHCDFGVGRIVLEPAELHHQGIDLLPGDFADAVNLAFLKQRVLERDAG